MSFDLAQDYNQKGFAPILIVLLIAVLGIGGYFVYTSLRGVPSLSRDDVAISPSVSSTPQPSPSPDKTANWKTYTNEKYGYSLKYPSDKFIDCSSKDTFSLYYKVSNDTVCGAGEGFPELSISVLDNITTNNLSSYPECYSTEEVPAKVGRVDGIKYTNTLKSEINDCNKTMIAYARLKNYVLINNNGTTFQISANDSVNKQLNLTQTIDQILSTFKFTR